MILGDVKKLRSRFPILRAEKGVREKRRITARTVQQESGVSWRLIYALEHDELDRGGKFDGIETLLNYFDCALDQLLETIEVSDKP